MGSTSRYFTRNNPYWENDPEYRRMYLMYSQHYLNALLRSRNVFRWVSLNEAYQQLGLSVTKVGALHGWGDDDSVVVSIEKEVVFMDPMTGEMEPGYLLGFNADSMIYETRCA